MPSATRAWARGRGEAYRTIAGWWLGSRVLVLGVALAAQAVRWPHPSWYPALSSEPFALLRAWDGRWYRIVASHGYLLLPGQQSDPAFFPLYAILLRAARLLGLGFTSAGVALSSLTFLGALFAVYALAGTWLPEPDARRAAVYAAVFPFGFVFSMVYPESLVLLASALAGVLAWRGRWLAAAIAVACATLGRPEGVLLTVPIGALVVRRWSTLETTERSRAVVAALAGPVTLATFALYQWQTTGTPLAFSVAERSWGRRFEPLGLWHALAQLATAASHHESWLYRDAVLVLVYACCLVLARRASVPRSWLCYGALILVLPLASGSINSDGRFGLLALPAYSGLAFLGRSPAIDRAIRVVSIVLLAAGTATILFHWP